MGELKKFLRLIRQYKLLLIVVPIVSIIITYFLVRNIPNSYMSQAVISTGIADDKQTSVLNEIIPNDRINQGFSNLIEMFKMKKVLDQVSYLLILHDLKSQKPFKKPSSLLSGLNESARMHAIDVYQSKYDESESLNLNDGDQKGLNQVLESMKYDSKSISEMVQVYRSGNSDFLIIQSESNNPVLSAFIANNLSSEFIKYYTIVVAQNQLKANAFLSELLKLKTDTLSKRVAALRNYKIHNRVLNLDEQSKQLYSRILDLDDKKQEAVQNTSSYAGALNEIDRKFSPNERRYIEASISKINQDIVSTKKEMSLLYQAYMDSDFDPSYKSSLDSLQLILDKEVQRSSDQYLVSPFATKQELMSEKIRLEVQLDLSRYSIGVLEAELDKLNNQFDNLVPKEAEVQSLELAVEIATKEYTEVLTKYNENSLESAFSNKLHLIQAALPGQVQPSKKMLLVIISGLVSLFFCLIFLFVLYYLDNSIRTAKELTDNTGYPVLGIVNLMRFSELSFKEIWSTNDLSPELMLFKNQLRSLRYEIDLLKANVIVITGVCNGEGKSFISMNLSASLMIASKKVLVIDGDFLQSTISETYSSSFFLEDYFNGNVSFNELNGPGVTILKNRGANNSLMEVGTEEEIGEKFNFLKTIFDVIIIDTQSIANNRQVKEWMTFSDAVVTVFQCGNTFDENEYSKVNLFDNQSLFKGWILNKHS